MNKTNRTRFLGIGLLLLLPFLLIVLFQPDNPNRYYINRGLERGLTMLDLQQQLLGQKIVLWHAQSWQTSGGHITQVKIGGEVVYNEWGK